MTDKNIPPFENIDVANIFANYPSNVRTKLKKIRALIFDTAAESDYVGPLDECLKWGEPAYLTTTSKSGSTIRLNAKPKDNGGFALYFNCQTNLVDMFKNHYADRLSFAGNRAIIFGPDDEIPMAELRHCIHMALTYHRHKKG